MTIARKSPAGRKLHSSPRFGMRVCAHVRAHVHFHTCPRTQLSCRASFRPGSPSLPLMAIQLWLYSYGHKGELSSFLLAGLFHSNTLFRDMPVGADARILQLLNPVQVVGYIVIVMKLWLYRYGYEVMAISLLLPGSCSYSTPFRSSVE